MPTYIVLCKWTEKGIEGVKESPSRLEAAKKVFKAAGGELKQFYLTQGRYDMVVVSELPNDEAAAKTALTIGAGGALRTESLRAFTEDEYRKIIASLP